MLTSISDSKFRDLMWFSALVVFTIWFPAEKLPIENIIKYCYSSSPVNTEVTVEEKGVKTKRKKVSQMLSRRGGLKWKK